jgi:ribosomal subunit interface protein
MKVNIESMDFKNFSSLEDYTNRRIAKSLGQFPFVTSAHVYFKDDQDAKRSKLAKIQLNVKNGILYAEALSNRFDAALDNAILKLKRQLEKYKYRKPRRKAE